MMPEDLFLWMFKLDGKKYFCICSYLLTAFQSFVCDVHKSCFLFLLWIKLPVLFLELSESRKTKGEAGRVASWCQLVFVRKEKMARGGIFFPKNHRPYGRPKLLGPYVR